MPCKFPQVMIFFLVLNGAAGCNIATKVAEEAGLIATAEARADNIRIEEMLPPIAAMC